MKLRPTGEALLVLDDGARVGVWDLEAGRFLRTWPHPRPGYGGFTAALSPDGTVLLTGGETQSAQLWDVATGKPKGAPLPHRASTLAFSPDGRTAATCGGWPRQVRLWDVATARALGAPLWHGERVYPLAFRPDGRLLAVGGSVSHLWQLPDPAAGDADALRRRMESLTGLQLDADGAIRELAAEEGRGR